MRDRRLNRRSVGRWFAGLPAAMLPAGLVLPALSVVGEPQRAGPLYFAICLAVAVAFAALALRLARGSLVAAIAGVLGIAAAGALLEQSSYPGAAAVVAAAMGWGIGALVEWPPKRRWRALSGLIGGCETLVLLRFGLGVWQAALVLALLAGWRLWSELRVADPGAPGQLRPPSYIGVATFLALFSTFWVGSTSPSVEWFGELTYHGPRDTGMVALTFDDGPNGKYTAEVARILEDRGVHATFFLVGKAVVQDPETARDLLASGHVVGNHSYNHGALSYLHPFYPELVQTQRVIAERIGVCPALFRPPHGTHTPFMSEIVADHGMQLVTWDVSAKDWVEDDAARLAKNILAKVKPGSIILLHDGIDGTPGADRSVVIHALPAILDGLQARGLKPVTLDVLLGAKPYLPLPECGVPGAPSLPR